MGNKECGTDVSYTSMEFQWNPFLERSQEDENIVVLTLIKCLALLSNPRVVWRELSAPTGTRSLRFSRQLLKCALRFFSNSLWVDLKQKQKLVTSTLEAVYFTKMSPSIII